MAKAKYRFLNDGEYETEIELTEEQQSFLRFLQDWGFLGDNLEVQEMERGMTFPSTFTCPECGASAFLCYQDDPEGFYHCDNCDNEFGVDFSEGVI